MASLHDYMKEVQRLARESKQELLNPADIITHINRARREIAMRSQCIRVLTPISGPCVSGSVTAGGTGYPGGATVVISAPDFPSGSGAHPNGDQATATATTSGGSVTGVNITYGGDGYFQPTASVVASSGSGASVSIQTIPLNVLNRGREVYPFSDVNLGPFPGVQSIYHVVSLTVIYSNYRYALPIYPFSDYQAYVRQYPFQYQYVPAFASQYKAGASGSFYVYPLPSQTYQFEMDCLCLPQDLLTNLSDEALQDPWTDAVPYLAAAYGFMELQNYNVANFYKQWFDEFVQRYSIYSRPGRRFNPYWGRY